VSGEANSALWREVGANRGLGGIGIRQKVQGKKIRGGFLTNPCAWGEQVGGGLERNPY